jgi:hypothetical protein
MRTLHARAAALRVVALPMLVLVVAGPSVSAQQRATRVPVDSLIRALRVLRASSDSTWIPSAEKFSLGDSIVAANHRTSGPVAIAGGTLDVRGVVAGDVVVYDGDVVVHQGGEVQGSAYAILGKVILDGGVVDGGTRTLSGDLRAISVVPGAVARSTSSLTMHALALAGGWLAMLVVVGIGVLLFASTNLDAVSDALGRGFGKSLFAGIATQLALAPALALLCVGLALTILGVLLIPFAVVAFILAAAGLVTLGFLAVARIAGGTVVGPDEGGEGARRIVALRAMAYGLVLLMVPWFAAGALSWSPTLELFARMIAVAVTWVAATAGLGAAVVSRGGVRRATAPAAARALNMASWATPTPVAGVTAARRPTPFSASVPK